MTFTGRTIIPDRWSGSIKPNKLNIPINKLYDILSELKVYVPCATLRDVKDIIELPDIGGDAGMRDFMERESAEGIVGWVVEMGMAEELWNHYEVDADKGMEIDMDKSIGRPDVRKRVSDLLYEALQTINLDTEIDDNTYKSIRGHINACLGELNLRDRMER